MKTKSIRKPVSDRPSPDQILAPYVQARDLEGLYALRARLVDVSFDLELQLGSSGLPDTR